MTPYFIWTRKSLERLEGETLKHFDELKLLERLHAARLAAQLDDEEVARPAFPDAKQ